jgi:hypothetical protein
MKLVICDEAFNRNDVLLLTRCRKRQARQGTLTIDDDGAYDARTLIAPVLGTRQAERVAKCVQQRKTRVVRKFLDRVVHTKRCSN